VSAADTIGPDDTATWLQFRQYSGRCRSVQFRSPGHRARLRVSAVDSGRPASTWPHSQTHSGHCRDAVPRTPPGVPGQVRAAGGHQRSRRATADEALWTLAPAGVRGCGHPRLRHVDTYEHGGHLRADTQTGTVASGLRRRPGSSLQAVAGGASRLAGVRRADTARPCGWQLAARNQSPERAEASPAQGLEWMSCSATAQCWQAIQAHRHLSPKCYEALLMVESLNIQKGRDFGNPSCHSDHASHTILPVATLRGPAIASRWLPGIDDAI
jgi:hypothetical protein